MRNTHSFKMNLPEMSDPVDVNELNDNFLVIDDALMAGLCKKELTTNNMGSSDPASRKYGWAPWLEIYNGNEFDVVVIDRNAPDLPSGTINIEAGDTYRMYINGTYYMNFYVQDQHDVTFRWFTNAETRINEIEPSGGGGVSSINVTGASGSHLETSGGPVTDSGTIEINLSTGYSIPSDEKQTEWDGKQDAISDLSTIRSGAASGATAVQPTALETALASKQDTISDLATIRSGAAAGATAVQPSAMQTALSAKQDSLDNTQLAAVNSGINSTKVGQISTNQANILYNLNMGVKNIIKLQAGTYKDNVATFTVTNDGEVLVSSTSSSTSAVTVNTMDLPAGDYVYYYDNTASSGACDVRLMNGSTRLSGVFTLSSAATISIAIFSYATNSNVSIKPMLCTAEAWAQEPNVYRKPALPNFELTRLESEDRASLAEVVDSGAKNLLKRTAIGSSWTDDNVTFTLNSDGSITINSTGTITANRYFAYFEGRMSELVNTEGNYVLFASASPNAQAQVWWYYTDDWTNVVETSGNSSRYISASDLNRPVIVRVRALAGNAISNVKVYPMICTKAAFDVSNKFVPYRPNYDLVSAYVNTARTKLVYCNSQGSSTTHKYTMQFSDFKYAQFTDSETQTCGTYLVSVVTWGYTPKHGLWIVSYSGGNRTYTALTNIVGADAATVSVVTDDGTPYIQVVASGKVAISTLN